MYPKSVGISAVMKANPLAGVMLATLTFNMVSSRQQYLLVEVPDQLIVDEPGPDTEAPVELWQYNEHKDYNDEHGVQESLSTF